MSADKLWDAFFGPKAADKTPIQKTDLGPKDYFSNDIIIPKYPPNADTPFSAPMGKPDSGSPGSTKQPPEAQETPLAAQPGGKPVQLEFDWTIHEEIGIACYNAAAAAKVNFVCAEPHNADTDCPRSNSRWDFVL